eukprot:5180908-Prymnesium_polylepis.1
MIGSPPSLMRRVMTGQPLIPPVSSATQQNKKGPTINEMALYLGMDPVRDKNLMWIAACAMREPPTPGWDEVTSAEGKTFFVNRDT